MRENACFSQKTHFQKRARFSIVDRFHCARRTWCDTWASTGHQGLQNEPRLEVVAFYGADIWPILFYIKTQNSRIFAQFSRSFQIFPPDPLRVSRCDCHFDVHCQFFKRTSKSRCPEPSIQPITGPNSYLRNRNKIRFFLKFRLFFL